MTHAGNPDATHWYAIHTKAKQELRASSNLNVYGVETFAPCIKHRGYRQYNGTVEQIIEPLFKTYIFARFKSEMLNRIRFTRGVKNVVSFAGMAIPIDDEIIYLIKSRMQHSFVKLNDDLNCGDEVLVERGALKGLCGIFDRKTKSSTRVLMLLKTVSFQAYAEVEEAQVRKVG